MLQTVAIEAWWKQATDLTDAQLKPGHELSRLPLAAEAPIFHS